MNDESRTTQALRRLGKARFLGETAFSAICPRLQNVPMFQPDIAECFGLS